MLLEWCMPEIPCTSVALIYITGALGAVLLIYGVFLEQERRQDLVKMIGAAALFVYALYTGDKLFMIAMGGLAIASLVEFVEIYMGLHKHSPEDLKRYKQLK
ncbi:MAG: hypothetical protein COU33_04165 [Candidatus Magasanikbacteria bacterium CG10_big_fil_rev_8_21_14_0_10_43_6]|uniref:Uncharacterized protein n=1 Tax=Candidatus Magasanikbacteria bacterium CG10_big_fil_rev_8_21_14_0_10_43_6 TaxID=1974650 RepID=A0A2M6W0C7_9BACT|nr:MAG: hypothetical protein COU33_04165 [Candidatus Magasanikbacteria bacterium CG10_big_fil_rev_8_21_14_0_10_43_6]